MRAGQGRLRRPSGLKDGQEKGGTVLLRRTNGTAGGDERRNIDKEEKQSGVLKQDVREEWLAKLGG